MPTNAPAGDHPPKAAIPEAGPGTPRGHVPAGAGCRASSDPDPPTAVAVAAIVRRGERGLEVLIARRREDAIRGGLWEFPGGKVEPGERAEEAARRESLEETGIRVAPGTGAVIATAVRGDPSLPRERTVAVTLVWFDAPADADPRPLGSDECRWEALDALGDYRWPDANAELIRALQAHARSVGP